MRGATIFNQHAQEYDQWFDKNEHIYQAEVNALRQFIPLTGLGIEIGVGTGRFSIPFDIRIGIEPAKQMAQIAKERGILVCQALGEQLPFRDSQFDFALLVTVLCFVSDTATILQETHKILRTNGRIIIGFIDRNSSLGQFYESRKEVSKLYREATFHSVLEISDYTKQAGFGDLRFCQTIFNQSNRTEKIGEVRNGCGEGAFVVLSAKKNA